MPFVLKLTASPGTTPHGLTSGHGAKADPTAKPDCVACSRASAALVWLIRMRRHAPHVVAVVMRPAPSSLAINHNRCNEAVANAQVGSANAALLSAKFVGTERYRFLK